MVRAFFFDLDGTLVDSERENADSIAAVLAARGRPISDEEREYVVGHGWREIYQHLASHGGVDLSFEELTAHAAAAKEVICSKRGLRTIPGAVDYVREAARHAQVAIVSGSTRREVEFCLRSLGIASVVPWFIAAEDVPRGKPSPDGYLAAAARAGVAPPECLVFEDSAAGITSARAAGMRCVALTAANFTGQGQGGADLIVRDFTEVGDRFFAPSADKEM